MKKNNGPQENCTNCGTTTPTKITTYKDAEGRAVVRECIVCGELR